MRAVVLEKRGGPEVLELREVQAPDPRPGEVLVEVASSALNRADLLQRMGLYPGPSADQVIPGLEFAGRVCALGAGSTRWRVGDEVMGIVSGGGHAEQLSINEDQAMRLPQGMSVSLAGALPEVFMTAWDALVLQGGLVAGGKALVHAGASGVGTAAIQICRMIGAEVVVTVSDLKRDRCLDLGAAAAVDYRSEDWLAVVADCTEGQGVDVVLDVVGGDYLDRNVDALANRGTIVQVGVMAGGTAQFGLAKLLPKRATIVGTVLRGRSLEEKISLSRAFEAEVVPRFDDQTLQLVVDRRYQLGQIADAHRYMETNANVGKIALDVVR